MMVAVAFKKVTIHMEAGTDTKSRVAKRTGRRVWAGHAPARGNPRTPRWTQPVNQAQEARNSNDSQPRPPGAQGPRAVRVPYTRRPLPTASGPQGALWARRGGRCASERRLPAAHARPRSGLAGFFFRAAPAVAYWCGMGSEAPASGGGGAVRSGRGEEAEAAAGR